MYKYSPFLLLFLDCRPPTAPVEHVLPESRIAVGDANIGIHVVVIQHASKLRVSVDTSAQN